MSTELDGVVTPADQPTDSAPVIESNALADQTTDSAPVQTEDTSAANIEDEGAKPAEKAVPVSEHIAQRKRRQQAEQEAAYWRGVAEGRIQPNVSTPALQAVPQVSAPLAPPKLDDFDNYDDYESAKETYLVAKAKDSFIQDFQRQSQMTQMQRIEAEYQARLDKEAEVDPVIHDMATSKDLAVNQAMALLIKRSDVAPQIIRYLYNHKQESMAISRLSPLESAYRLGQIEAEIKNTPKPAPPKKVSMAPEPIKTVQATGAPTVDENTLPIDEWITRRNKSAGLR